MSSDESDNQLDRLIRFPELERIFGVCKRTIRRKSGTKEYPPLRNSGGVVGMLESDVKSYFQLLRQSVMC
jgi:predicted DNA-binding transcriptional regulator AlpA